MRQPRLKVPADSPVGYYHCISRIVDRRFALGKAEKNYFVKLVRELSDFCEIGVVTYCVMDNHFHLLLAVPRPPEAKDRPDGDRLLEKLNRLSVLPYVGRVRQQLESFRVNGDKEGEAELLKGYHARMWDLSMFMKLLKQRFSQWYNRRQRRTGTLWEERYRSLVVEGSEESLAAVAAYIDLNPVRAGIVDDPKDYRWSGYGEAMGGKREAKEGLKGMMEMTYGKHVGISAEELLGRYRVLLYQVGDEQREGIGEGGLPKRGSLRVEEVRKEIERRGRLPMWIYLRCQVRYFVDGVVLGSREFVEMIWETKRERYGAKRKTGARRMRGLEEKLYTMRDLKKRLFSWERDEARIEAR